MSSTQNRSSPFRFASSWIDMDVMNPDKGPAALVWRVMGKLTNHSLNEQDKNKSSQTFRKTGSVSLESVERQTWRIGVVASLKTKSFKKAERHFKTQNYQAIFSPWEKWSPVSLLWFCRKSMEAPTPRCGPLPNIDQEPHFDPSPCKSDCTISSFACSRGFYPVGGWDNSAFTTRQCGGQFYKDFN